MPPIEPARRAAAQRVIDAIWPLGTYGRVMKRSMDGAMSMMTGDLIGGLTESARAKDPYFDERMRLTMGVMAEEMAKLMTKYEPGIRAGLADAYGRHFDLAQLNDLDRFFATPTGKLYASESMVMMTDPALMKRMQAFLPDMMAAMPDIIKHMQQATAHLPPPPRSATDDAAHAPAKTDD